MYYFYRLYWDFSELYLNSTNKTKFPTNNDFIFNLYYYFVERSDNFENNTIFRGFKILFYDSLSYLTYCDEFFENNIHLLIKKESRKKILDALLNLDFIKFLDIDNQLFNKLENLKKDKAEYVVKFKKEIENDYLKFKFELSSFSKLIKILKEELIYSFVKKYKIDYLKINNISNQRELEIKEDKNFSLKLLVAFSFFPYFNYSEEILFQTVFLLLNKSLDRDLEIETDTNKFFNFVNKFSNIILGEIFRDSIHKKKKEDSEIEILKLI